MRIRGSSRCRPMDNRGGIGPILLFGFRCALGAYNFGFMLDVTIEIMEMYNVDGIFSNRWSGSGMCYCKSCQRLFHDYSGNDLPRTTNPLDPVRKQYLLWR